MVEFIKKVSKNSMLAAEGLAQGAKEETDKARITLIDYDESNFQEKEVTSIEEVFPFKDTSTVSWVNIDGLDIDVIEKVGSHFEMHPLTLEDIVITAQRPKYEDFDKYIFIVLKMFMYDKKIKEVTAEQLSLIFGANFVISIQEKQGDVFNPIRERIRSAKGRIRKMGADYLAYSLLDAIVDNYFLVLEKLGENIEEMEEGLVANPEPKILHNVYGLKRDIIFLRKSVWPLRDAASSFERSESKLIKKSTHIFLRDLYDHTIQVIDTIETYRDMVSGILDIYLSSLSNKMNEVMKVLTMFASVFIPLTFIVGIYGMNFNPQSSPWNMPELNWRFGYLGVWAVMIAVVVSMVFYFKRKKWL